MSNTFSKKGRHPVLEIDGIWIDQEIAPLVRKLWAKGVITRSCCQGDEDHWGHVMIGFPYGIGPAAYQAALATTKLLTSLFQTIATTHAPQIVESEPMENLVWREPESPTETGLTIRFDHRLLPTLIAHIDNYLAQQYDAETVAQALQNP